MTVMERSCSREALYLACYKVENKKPQQMNKYVMDKDTCSVYMRYASVAAGDIDFDGFPEVVVAGVYSDNDGPDGDKSGSNKSICW